MNNVIYFDNSATTSLNEEVFNSMKEFLLLNYSNPSSVYEFSQKSRVAIEKSRENIASYINANKNELFFTSGGTESDNWALVGATLFKGKKSGHIVTTAFEHSAVLESAKFLEKMGFEVTYISPKMCIRDRLWTCVKIREEFLKIWNTLTNIELVLDIFCH